MFSIFYYFFSILFTVIYFVLILILFLVTVLFDKERIIIHRASRIWASTLYWCCPGWRIRVEGCEHIDPSKAYVIVTNHQTMLDIPLMYVLPLNFKWVSKQEVLRLPIFGWVLQMHGDIAIERGSSQSTRNMMEQARQILHRGTSVILFPEGTRTKDGQIGRFKEGAFLMAKNAGVGILPVVHEGSSTALKGWHVVIPHTFRVHVMEPLSPEQVAATPLKELTALVGERMRQEHNTMIDPKQASKRV